MAYVHSMVKRCVRISNIIILIHVGCNIIMNNISKHVSFVIVQHAHVNATKGNQPSIGQLKSGRFRLTVSLSIIVQNIEITVVIAAVIVITVVVVDSGWHRG